MLRKELSKFVKKYEHVKQIHGFYYDSIKQIVSFDLVISFDAKNRRELFNTIVDSLKQDYPQYNFNINMDIDLSD